MAANPLLNAAIAFGDAVTDVGTVLLYPLGTKREQGGNTYRYVQLDAGATASVAGKLAFRAGSGVGPFIVTATAANTAPNLSAGVFLAVIAASGYGWIQTKGRHATVATSGADDIAKGDIVIEALSNAGTVRRMIVATADTAAAVLVQQLLDAHPVGVALDADIDANNTVDCMIDLE